MKIRARFNFFQVKATLGAGVQKIRMQQIRRILSNIVEYYRILIEFSLVTIDNRTLLVADRFVVSVSVVPLRQGSLRAEKNCILDEISWSIDWQI